MAFMDDFGHLKIQLKDIKLATNDFGDKPIGMGGFGRVYKGEISLPEGKKLVAIKRLDRKHGQGDVEFWKEIMMLSQYKHENLISLLHFCNEDDDRILVYEYAPRGSLDCYLGKTSLTWSQLLKICHGAASGLNYLHEPMNSQQRILHRDVKSSNILVDANFNAKISDFGLSKIGPANQQYTYLFSNIAGTPGYCDPVYLETGSLSKESDVYSFGVVLFEVICGKLCFEYCNGETKFLVPVWKQCYEENRLDDIVCIDLKEQMDGDSLITFSSIAYRCLNRTRKERPTTAEIVKELEIALDHQEMSQDVVQRSKFEERVSIANQSATHIPWRSRSELALVLSQGILIKGGDHWVSQNKLGEYYEIISGKKCIRSDHTLSKLPLHAGPFSGEKCFPWISLDSNFRIQASPQFLTPHVTYSINLVYTYNYYHSSRKEEGERVPLKYKLHTETEYQTSCVANMRDGQLKTELYQFNSDKKEHDFWFDFLGQLPPIYSHGCGPFHRELHTFTRFQLLIIGIEFLPVEHAKDENSEGKRKLDTQPNIDHTDGEKKLPSDCAEIIKSSKNNIQWSTDKELYYIFRKGFLIKENDEQHTSSVRPRSVDSLINHGVLKGSKWKSLLGRKKWTWKSLPESRFQLVAEFCEMESFTIRFEIKSRFLSPETTYAFYLVHKLPTKQHSMFKGLVQIENKEWEDADTKSIVCYTPRFVDLLAPTHVPCIRDNVDESHIPSRTRQIKGHPKLRKDGWMEVQIWDFRTSDKLETTSMQFRMWSCNEGNFRGLLVQGIEFRPAKVTFMQD